MRSSCSRRRSAPFSSILPAAPSPIHLPGCLHGWRCRGKAVLSHCQKAQRQEKSEKGTIQVSQGTRGKTDACSRVWCRAATLSIIVAEVRILIGATIHRVYDIKQTTCGKRPLGFPKSHRQRSLTVKSWEPNVTLAKISGVHKNKKGVKTSEGPLQIHCLGAWGQGKARRVKLLQNRCAFGAQPRQTAWNQPLPLAVPNSSWHCAENITSP